MLTLISRYPFVYIGRVARTGALRLLTSPWER